MTIWRMRISCCLHKVTNTHSEFVTLIAFPLQQWLQDRASLLRYTYIACLVLIFRQLAIMTGPLTNLVPCICQR